MDLIPKRGSTRNCATRLDGSQFSANNLSESNLDVIRNDGLAYCPWYETTLFLIVVQG